jgi:hypothetical protein
MRFLILVPLFYEIKTLCKCLKHTAGNSIEDILSLSLAKLSSALTSLFFTLLELLISKVDKVLISNFEDLVALSFREGSLKVFLCK